MQVGDDNKSAGDAGDVVPQEIGVGHGASVASNATGATSLGLGQFRQTRCTIEELMGGNIIARKQDLGIKGSKTYIAICRAATTALPDKLLGSCFLGAKNKDGELLNRHKSIQEDYLSNLQALKPIIDQMEHYDMKSVLNIPSFYDDTGLTFEDRWGFTNPDFSLVDMSQNWNKVTLSHCKNWQQDMNNHAADVNYESSIWTKELLESCLDPELKKKDKDQYD